MKKNIFLITEDERERILGMHKRATASHYLSEAGPFEDTDPLAATTPPAAGTTPPAAGTTPPTSQILTANDRDYVYKKEGDKYFFKLQANPASATAQQYKTAGRFLDWTEAKGKGLAAIQKLNFKPETMATASVVNTKVTKSSEQTPTTPTTAQTAPPVKPLATGGGSQLAGQTVTGQTDSQVSADLKSASQIRQEFRQGKRDMRKIQRERDKLYNTYNRLSGKMDKATDKSYLDSIAQLDQLLSQK
jgi:hypothetical protein